MATKKQRRKIKQLRKLPVGEIAKRVGIREKDVSEILGGGNKYQPSRIRTYLAVGLVLTGIGGGLISYFLRHQTYNQETPKIERLESLDVIQKFDRLPIHEQNGVLSHLERFVAEQTEIGRIAKDISDRVKVPEVESITLQSDRYVYEPIDNVIYFKQKLGRNLLQMYLDGEPPLFVRVHEKLHFIQDTYSQWDKLENFFKSKDPSISQRSEITTIFTLTQEEIRNFITKFYAKLDIPFDEAEKLLVQLVAKYHSIKYERGLIREVQAHLNFIHSSSAEHLYKLLQHEAYKNFMDKLDRKKFDQTFRSTIELATVLEPIESAKFVGKYGDSVERYQAEVEKLKSQRDIPDAFQRGLDRQKRLFIDLESIRSETARHINEIYSYSKAK